MFDLFMRLRMALLVCFIIGLWTVVVAEGQEQPPRLKFDVATIKPVRLDNGPLLIKGDPLQEMMDNLLPPGWLPVLHGRRLAIERRTLRSIIASAYRVRPRQVMGPGWLDEVWFHIEAQLPEASIITDANEMLQALLEERFGLRTHRESRDTSGYALILGDKKASLKPAGPLDNSTSPEEQRTKMMAAVPSATTQNPQQFAERRQLRNVSLENLAENLAQIMHVPVVDMTSLQGKYDIDLRIPRPELADDPIDRQVSEALRPLGLKLKYTKVPIEALVIDAINRTVTPN